MAKYYCGLCKKKLAMLEDYVWLSKDIILCGECRAIHDDIVSCMNNEAAFKAKMEKIKKCFSEDEHAELIACWNRMYEAKLVELEAERIREEELRKQEEQLQKEAEEQQRIAIENERRRQQQVQQQVQQEFNRKIDNLSQQGYDGYYEFKVISLLDEDGLYGANSGRVNVSAMSYMLNQLGLEGWRLVTAYSNEIGKNSSMMTNATIDEHIIIFERYVRITKSNS